jgi:arginine/ornithine transport system permease protein
MNFEIILESLPQYWQAAWVTLQLLFMALLIGLTVAIPLAVLRAANNPWFSKPIWVFTYLIRGTPMLVQLFLIYYGAGQFEWIRESVMWPYLSSAWFCAVMAFAINTCAYTTEMLAGAIKATPIGEVEAALSMGMSRVKMFVRILLPAAFRRALPAYSNEVIMMLHGTSLASTVTIMDLTGVAREVYSRHYLPYEAFIVAAVFYLTMTFVLVAIARLAEKHFLKHLVRKAH